MAVLWANIAIMWVSLLAPTAVRGIDPFESPRELVTMAAVVALAGSLLVAASCRACRTATLSGACGLAASAAVSVPIFSVLVVLHGGLADAQAVLDSLALGSFLVAVLLGPALALVHPRAAAVERAARRFSCSGRDGAVEWAAFGAVIPAILGVYLGALALLLDWEEPWQRWPLTGAFGAAAGATAGAIGATAAIARVLCTGKALARPKRD
ncbi:hypothetical protein FNF29_03147 [Cafeteria roenbergensis]|uniref:Dolichol kinase n=3 Tax=Cafeteria roenbergensis TaxID=33653 RepID=A0A5A8CLJ8_CAFRO|nr:hypothetical protein FNF29_03147 [Cafeteria roenbergensis]|eukprot:KAA0153334.1 hypothetical protein FNF29_03147 [Cafeteria roenbergensis]